MVRPAFLLSLVWGWEDGYVQGSAVCISSDDEVGSQKTDSYLRPF